MEWIDSLSRAISYIEENLEDDLSVDAVAERAFAASSHFQLIFHVVMGITVGEYIRNRRLSRAADAIIRGERIIDVAMNCRYDTQESFSKAFTRFHGTPPSKINRANARVYGPLSISITIEGGFAMANKFTDEFKMMDWTDIDGRTLTDAEKYGKITKWALDARRQNPGVFDALAEWIRDDSQWTDDKLAENEQILMRGVFKRFADQNARLRAYLTELKPSGIVNEAVFKMLDLFDEELSGKPRDEALRVCAAKVFADFSNMRDRETRRLFAGGKTGPTGTDSVDVFGCINSLDNCDSQVQWALFMPDLVKQQQNGFRVESFEYRKLPALRFIGIENPEDSAALFETLDGMREYASEIPFDAMFMHHNGLNVDVGQWHGIWGRFMREGAPVPKGFIAIDLARENDGRPGAPYVSSFAYAVFTGDADAMQKTEGYDVDAMYDVTRNIILGQGMNIPYPNKYWTAAICRNGWENPCDAYMFSVDLT